METQKINSINFSGQIYDITVDGIDEIRDNATSGSTALTNLGGFTLLKITQADYDALSTYDANTLYIING